MSFIVKATEGSTFKPAPPGMYLARCYRIVDLGTQAVEYMGTTKYLPKVMFQWELHGEDDNGEPLVTQNGDPMSISKNYTVSLSEKSTLRKDLTTWRGRDFTAEELRGFELKNVLGAWCTLSVVETARDGKTYANVAAVMPVPAAVKKAGLPEGQNEEKLFHILNPDMELFNSFSENLRAKIERSPEWQSRKNATTIPTSGAPAYGDLENDVPF